MKLRKKRSKVHRQLKREITRAKKVHTTLIWSDLKCDDELSSCDDFFVIREKAERTSK